MLISSLILLLLSNAVTPRRDKSILFSRVAILILLYSTYLAYNDLDMSFLEKGIGLYGGLFHATSTTQIFHLFIFFLSAIILSLTAFYPVLALSLAIALFSFIGVPPLIGFFAKQMVLNAVLDNDYIIALLAILTSVIICPFIPFALANT